MFWNQADYHRSGHPNVELQDGVHPQLYNTAPPQGLLGLLLELLKSANRREGDSVSVDYPPRALLVKYGALGVMVIDARRALDLDILIDPQCEWELSVEHDVILF